MSDWVIRLIDSGGYAGVFLLMLLETMFPPIPSEVVLPIAGMRAADGPLGLPGVIVASTLGTMIGNTIWYLAARSIGLEALPVLHRPLRALAGHRLVRRRAGAAPVRPVRRGDRLLRPDAADDPHLHLDPRRDRADGRPRFLIWSTIGTPVRGRAGRWRAMRAGALPPDRAGCRADLLGGRPLHRRLVCLAPDSPGTAATLAGGQAVRTRRRGDQIERDSSSSIHSLRPGEDEGEALRS